jgi:hypothetical protein
MTLADFLLARITEDETEAEGLQAMAHGIVDTLRDPKWLGHAVPGWAYWPDVEALTIRVLSECDARRRVVQVHAAGEHMCPSEEASRDGLWSVTDQDVMSPCPTLLLLALPYAGHPDYDPEWRP